MAAGRLRCKCSAVASGFVTGMSRNTSERCCLGANSWDAMPEFYQFSCTGRAGRGEPLVGHPPEAQVRTCTIPARLQQHRAVLQWVAPSQCCTL